MVHIEYLRTATDHMMRLRMRLMADADRGHNATRIDGRGWASGVDVFVDLLTFLFDLVKTAV